MNVYLAHPAPTTAIALAALLLAVAVGLKWCDDRRVRWANATDGEGEE